MTGECALFLDFDGVLAVPHTHPPVLFGGVAETLRKLHADGFLLAVTSFNPEAEQALRNCGVAHLFCAMRCGSHDRWEGPYVPPEYELSKANQIRSMLQHELERDRGREFRFWFFDDSPANVLDVESAELSGCRGAHLVDTNLGFTVADLHAVTRPTVNV